VVTSIEQQAFAYLNIENATSAKTFLQERAHNFKTCTDINLAHETNATLVFKVNVKANQDVLLKVPKTNDDFAKVNMEQFIHATQLRKLAFHKDYVPEVYEDIVLFNPKESKVSGYASV
jgi:hypothetical protein